MRVVGYVRVSTKKQVDGYSLKLQRSKITEYCKLMDYDLVDIYEDKGVSGLTISKRIGYQQMIDYVEQNDVDGVVVFSLSRLGRKMRDVVDFIEELKHHNKSFYSIKEGLSNDDKIGGLIMNILSSINQFEVEQTQERIRDVKREKKAKGLVYGRLQYGYDNVEGKLVRNEYEFSIIRRVKNLRTRGYSWNKIANRLNKDNVPTKNNGVWNMGTLYNMFNVECVQ